MSCQLNAIATSVRTGLPISMCPVPKPKKTFHWYEGAASSFSVPLAPCPMGFTDDQEERYLREQIKDRCYHEAGHLVAALRTGFPLSDDPDREFQVSAGWTETFFKGGLLPHVSNSSRLRIGIEDAVIILLAGGAAVSKLNARVGFGWSEGDLKEARHLVKFISPVMEDRDLPCLDYGWSFCGSDHTELHYYFETLRYRALRFASGYWIPIKLIAKVLMRDGRITKAEVERLAGMPRGLRSAL